jgi:two-component system cell cycle response regulator
LESAGYETLGAQDGEAALRLAREHKPDLMLLDVNLPDISGLEVCKQMKADPELRGVFVVMLSAMYTDSDSQSEGLEAGADGYIARPIANRELVARVQAMLRIRAAEQAARQHEQQLHDLIASNVDGLLVLDESGHTLFANQATCEMLNLSEEELKKKEISLPIAAGEPIELDLLSPDVGQQVVEVRVVQVQWDGQPALLASLRDITARKQAETETQRRLDQAEQSHRTLLSILEDSKRTEEKIRQQLEELKLWHDLTLDRETRTLELKREVNELLRRLNEPIRYPSAET